MNPGTIAAGLAFAGAAVLVARIPGAWPLLLAAAGLNTLVWLASLPTRNAGLVDIAWGPLFALMAWVGVGIFGRELEAGALVALVLVTLWATRLALHLAVRNLGKPEDRRYRRFREEAGASFPLRSLVTIFWLQAFLAWVILAPVIALLAAPPAAGAWSWWQTVGVAAFVVGFLFEAIADWQLVRFKADPANEGAVLDRGLWALSRHPNYFGEAVLWWGLYGYTVPFGGAPFVLGPMLITWMLLRVSGVTMLEEDLQDRKPAYRDYVRRTPSFVPCWPSARSGS